MSNTNTPKIVPLDEPLSYEDAENIPEEHKKKVANKIQELDQDVLQFRSHADACYAASSIEELKEKLDLLEFEVAKEFFYGLATQPAQGLPQDSALWELMVLAQQDPKSAARWCADLDPEYGTAYAMGWVQKQQSLLSLGLPNDASQLAGGRALPEATPAKALPVEPDSRSVRDRVTDTVKESGRKVGRWLLNRRNKD